MEFLELLKLRTVAAAGRDVSVANFACMGED
jgi:hypothetical protein